MKQFILLATCAFILAGCGEAKNPRTQKEKPCNAERADEDEKKLPAPTIKVYVENSGSMDGYVKGKTDFENAVYSYLSDIQHADIGKRCDSTATKNTMVLNYINSEVLEQKSDIKTFIDALEPADFRMKGGKRGTSDMSNILGTIISRTEDNDVSILVSDCIFSPDKKYQAKDNADEYLVEQQIDIKNHILEKLTQYPDFAFVVMRLMSQFNGFYYNKFDDKQHINTSRPFYIWLIGNKPHLLTILNQVGINQIKGSGVQNVFAIAKSDTLSYSIAMPRAGKGKYRLERAKKGEPIKTITDAKAEGRGGANCFEVNIPVDFSKVLLPDEYLTDAANYTVSNKAYKVEIDKYTGSLKGQYTHTIKLILSQPSISKGEVKISLLNNMPSWVVDCTDEEGVDINEPGAMDKTYGLKYLLGGLYDAYLSDAQYGNITINIK